MKLVWTWLSLALLCLGAGTVFGQNAVQLPTFSFFSGSTTVSVPDRGSTYFGGVNRARSGMNEFGTPLLPFRSRSSGFERRASNVSVSVFIHDFEAMDRYLLSQPTSFRAAQRRQAGVEPRAGALATRSKADDLRPQRPEQGKANSGGPATMSVAQLQAMYDREQQARQDEALQWFERGRKAEASGKANVARVYYRMAARRATGELKNQVAARLQSVSGSPATPKLAQAQP